MGMEQAVAAIGLGACDIRGIGAIPIFAVMAEEPG